MKDLDDLTIQSSKLLTILRFLKFYKLIAEVSYICGLK